jgi:hypothetical protein
VAEIPNVVLRHTATSSPAAPPAFTLINPSRGRPGTHERTRGNGTTFGLGDLSVLSPSPRRRLLLPFQLLDPRPPQPLPGTGGLSPPLPLDPFGVATAGPRRRPPGRHGLGEQRVQLPHQREQVRGASSMD